ncbi:MAG: bifunctional serine/threonine-protein kinase/formylglycine-generating enzyme family protein [Chloroflexales bacterium]
MQICKDGCGTHNPDTASVCLHCHRSLRSSLRLYNPGDRVRHYRVGAIIGWGGFGAVYKAEDTRQPGSRFALKESLDPSGMTSFQGEFAVLQQHPHPHLPRYEEMFVEQGNGYLVMEFIPGQSLEEVSAAAGGPLEEEQVLGFALQLCKVLDYLHRQNPPILHRDLKPANVRLTPSGLIKLVDFGLFKQGTNNVISSRLGLSPAYAPLEQHPLNPGHTDQRSDIYSFGATLYQLLTGELPETSFERIKAATDPLVPPERLNPRLSRHVATAITKALSLAMQDRYQGVAAFRQVLLGQAPVPSPPQAPPVRVPQARVAVPTMRVLPPWLPELIPIPAGPFLMGSSDADTLAYDDEKPQHTLTLPDFWIAKTPVTNAQFRPFVEGDGYRNRQYWTQAGWQWCQKEKLVKPLYWDDKQWWNGDNYPMVGVSWFEAVAYCRWLSAQTGHEFRLPSEAEWERAARGTDGRIWPWGNTWEAGRCNSKESGIGKTTPVSQYPNGASPYGVLDMAGNVWEWCATKWQKPYPYQVEDEWQSAYLEDGDSYRVWRGGSCFSEQKHVRGAFRYHYINARNRYNNRGLRVASRSPLPGSVS